MADRNNRATRKAFVTGWPVAHSRSPLIHGHWLKTYGLDGSYELFPAKPDDLAKFIGSLDDNGFIGGNVTVPHKEKALALAEHVDEIAKAIGAVNTLWLENGKLHATNTDAYGFAANLDDRCPGWDMKRPDQPVLILGAGGSTRAVLHVLQHRNFQKIYIANRTVENAQKLVDEFDINASAHGWSEILELSQESHLIINTTSLWMTDPEAPMPIDFSKVPNQALVTDIVYTPLITPLLKAASNHGHAIVDGLGMLLHQAVPGFERWFGVKPEVTEELRQIVLDDLGLSVR